MLKKKKFDQVVTSPEGLKEYMEGKTVVRIIAPRGGGLHSTPPGVYDPDEECDRIIFALKDSAGNISEVQITLNEALDRHIEPFPQFIISYTNNPAYFHYFIFPGGKRG